MNATPTCLRMRRYPGIISSAQHTAAPPAHHIAVKAHKSRRKSENDVFKCILNFERGSPDPLDPPPCIRHPHHDVQLFRTIFATVDLYYPTRPFDAIFVSNDWKNCEEFAKWNNNNNRPPACIQPGLWDRKQPIKYSWPYLVFLLMVYIGTSGVQVSANRLYTLQYSIPSNPRCSCARANGIVYGGSLMLASPDYFRLKATPD